MAGGWNMGRATSALHKAMRRGDVETAAYAAAWLSVKLGSKGREAAWRRLLAFPSEDLCGEGSERVAALHTCFKGGYELDALFAAILYLADLVKPGTMPERRQGELLRWADELKNAALFWVENNGREIEVPDYALDVHTGEGSLAGWWEDVNRRGPPSLWREDAMRYEPRPRAEKAEQPKLFDEAE